MKQIQTAKQARRSGPAPLDLRSPSGKTLPY